MSIILLFGVGGVPGGPAMNGERIIKKGAGNGNSNHQRNESTTGADASVDV